MEKDSTHPKILNFSLDIFSPHLIKGYRFVVDGQDNSEIRFVLINENNPSSLTDANDKLVPVVLMNNGYWFSCGFSFYKRKQNKKDLKQLCLRFFDDKHSLFRADWACLELPESKIHAQPHWHFDAEIKIQKEILKGASIPSFNDYQDNTKQSEESVMANLGRFHFFMNWDTEKEKQVQAPFLDFRNESVLRNWLSKAMEYIDTELRLLVKR